MITPRTALVWHERMMWHDTGSGTSDACTGGMSTVSISFEV